MDAYESACRPVIVYVCGLEFLPNRKWFTVKAWALSCQTDIDHSDAATLFIFSLPLSLVLLLPSPCILFWWNLFATFPSYVALGCCPKTQSLWTQTRWCCQLNSPSCWRKHSTTGIPTFRGYVSGKPAALCMTHRPVVDIKLLFPHKHKVVAATNAHAALPSALDSMQLLFIWVTLCTFPWFPNWLYRNSE